MWSANSSLLREKLWVLSPELKVEVVSQPILPTLMWSPRLLDVKGLLHQFLVVFFFFFFKRRNWCLMITWIINDMLSKLYFFVGDAFLTSKIMYSYNDKLLSLGCVLATKFYSTLCDHMHYSCQVSLHGILQARRLEWVPIPFSRGSFQPTNWTPVSWIASIFVTIGATWEPDLGYSSTNFPYQIVVLHVI